MREYRRDVRARSPGNGDYAGRVNAILTTPDSALVQEVEEQELGNG